MYTPIKINELECNIYEVCHNNLNKLIIISGKPLCIVYHNNTFIIQSYVECGIFVHCSKFRSKYVSKIHITIDGNRMGLKVNKYPDIKDMITIVTIIHSKDNFIKYWINLYIKLGVERFIIYDNTISNTSSTLFTNTNDSKLEYGLKNLLEDFITRGIVILIDWNYSHKIYAYDRIKLQLNHIHTLFTFKYLNKPAFVDINE